MNSFKTNLQPNPSNTKNDGTSDGQFIINEPQSLEPYLAIRIPKWKRSIDIIGAVLSLIMFLPVFVFSIVFIKIVSPGPVFFKQIRTGYQGKPFFIWKFRTMHINADSNIHAKNIREEIKNDQVLKKVQNDPRIIPFGNFLRDSSIDELPQLFNVLKGEMSLVGPRPELPYAVEEFKLWHCARLDILPGMTGLWQINGKNTTTFSEMIRYDIEYVRRLSFIQEMKILLMTIPSIIKNARENSD